jgi:hypothetical protein
MKKLIPKLEVPLILLIVVGLFINYLINSPILLTLSMGTLAVLYFLFANTQIDIPLEEEIKKREENVNQSAFKELFGWSILPRVLWISSSVSLVGILFYLNNYIGYLNLVSLGGFTLVVGCFLMFFLRSMPHMDKIFPILRRAVPLALISIYIMYLSGSFN